MPRAAFYIDGFNLYHSLAELGQPHLKWVNYWRLAELAMERSDHLVKVVVCTAYHPDFRKRVRHERHLAALRNVGVVVKEGHYVHDDMDCRQCLHTWKKPTEKEGDINVAISVIDDAHADVFDHAYLVSTDSDQAATARLFASRFPHKRLYSVAPPKRAHSFHILGHTRHKVSITESMVDLAVFEGVVAAPPGGRAVIRPREYDPPAGWVHPSQRP